jgi:hypothetical protein
MDDDEIIAAIRGYPLEAADALATIQTGLGTDRPLTADSLALAGQLLEVDPLELWLSQLKERGLVPAFISAMRARGIAFTDDLSPVPASNFSALGLEQFLPRARSFRCRILKNGSIAGSGVLVGPSLVLTAWHVIATDAPGKPQEPAPKLEVRLADGTTQVARVPAAVESMCGDDEFLGHAPTNDTHLTDRNDVAVLAMERPAALHLGYVELMSPPPPLRSKDDLVLVHFPEGDAKFIGIGTIAKIRNVTARWRHTIGTKDGSSGGACFNKQWQLVGIHQGKFAAEGRFVPLNRFAEPVLAKVAEDRAPTTLWSLDGTPDGQLVIGRGDFFRAVAVAGDPARRVRGVHVKRRVVEAGSAGLSFSADVLEQLLARRGLEHRVVRVTQEEAVADLVADIRRRAAISAIHVPEPHGEPGVALSAAPPETTAKDRAAVLASALNNVAASQGLIVWFFFDNPRISVSESARLAFEGFVGAALAQPQLRLVIAGFETLPLPGEEFRSPSPVSEGPPGLVVETIGGFRPIDVKEVLSVASRELTGAIDVTAIEWATKTALVNVPHMNEVYDDDQLPIVTERVRNTLKVFAAQGGGHG